MNETLYGFMLGAIFGASVFYILNELYIGRTKKGAEDDN